MKTEIADLDVHADENGNVRSCRCALGHHRVDEYVAAFPIGHMLFIVAMTPKSAKVSIGGTTYKVQISGETPTRSELFAKLQEKISGELAKLNPKVLVG